MGEPCCLGPADERRRCFQTSRRWRHLACDSAGSPGAAVSKIRSRFVCIPHISTRSAVVIEQPEKGLFFSATMCVEGPREKRLSIVDQAKIRPHANDAFGAAVSTSTPACEFVEPQWSRQVALFEKCAE